MARVVATQRKPGLEHLGVIEEQLRRLLARARALSTHVAAAAHPQLEPAIYATLMEIVRQAPIRSVDLAARRGVSKSVISRQVADLERLGFIGREPDPDDARASVIVPTNSGRKAARTGDAARRAYLERLLHGLPSDELARIAASLTTLNDALE